MNQQHPLFPVNMKTQWQDPKSVEINAYLRDWLLDPSSLTARLKQHCQRFDVKVLGQHVELCHEEEANDDIKAGERVLVREVLLYCDDVAQVFARSLLPLRSLTGQEQQLAYLGSQSLGQILFNNPGLIRKCIEISSFDQHSCVAKLLPELALSLESSMWGRRSVFVLHDKPLMVAEIFLPGAFAYHREKTA